MSLFDQLGQKQPVQTPQNINPMQMLFQIRRNPVAVLKQLGLEIPNGMTDPEQMVKYIIQSGQRSNGLYQQIMQRFGGR